MEAVSTGDLSIVNDILGNITSLYSLGFEDASSIVFSLGQYFRNANCSENVVEKLIRKLLVTNLSQDEFETFFFSYFTMQLDKPYHEIRKKLLPVFIMVGVDIPLLTSVLCKYIDKYAWDGDLKYFDECYVEVLLENGADPNLDVRIEPHGYSDIKNAMSIAGDIHYESKFTTYSLFNTLGKYGGDIRIAIESCDLYGGGGLLDLQRRGVNIELKPNHIGRDGETDVTRELIALIEYDEDVTHVLKTLSILKEAGADFDCVNTDGNTPLHIVINLEINLDIDSEVVQVIEYLLSQDVSMNLENIQQKTPITKLLTSIKKRDKKTLDRVKRRIDLLIKSGASVSHTTANGLTAFQTAADEIPSLLPYLRKYLDRAPNNIVEEVLFKGKNALNYIEPYIENALPQDKTQALSAALILKLDEIVDRLLFDDINILAATEKFRGQVQKDSSQLTYPLKFLKAITKFHYANVEPFWRQVLEIDRRDKARDIATQQLTKILGDTQTSTMVKKTGKVFDQEKQNRAKRSEQFLNRIKKLLSYLILNKVVALDVYTYHILPSEAGFEVLTELMTSSGKEGDLKYCWLDTKNAKNDARGGKATGSLIKAVDSIHIHFGVYYDEEYEKELIKTAQLIIESAKYVNLEVEWDGNTSSPYDSSNVAAHSMYLKLPL